MATLSEKQIMLGFHIPNYENNRPICHHLINHVLSINQDPTDINFLDIDIKYANIIIDDQINTPVYSCADMKELNVIGLKAIFPMTLHLSGSEKMHFRIVYHNTRYSR